MQADLLTPILRLIALADAPHASRHIPTAVLHEVEVLRQEVAATTWPVEFASNAGEPIITLRGGPLDGCWYRKVALSPAAGNIVVHVVCPNGSGARHHYSWPDTDRVCRFIKTCA